MKRLHKRALLFLVLMLFLAAGLSYLGFTQTSKPKTKKGKEVQTMDVALVNEDNGATFNHNEISFGDAFIRSMDKDDKHDWYVVSRGVAESGLERNTYDMMIVIPNDFSEKALSMDLESPDHVLLNYKINATGSRGVKAEAEKTASEILNDFNRRIIDVYFASIIGNLQDAQDSIGTIVEKQGEHTYTYNNVINNPLTSYTDRFKAVQDNTKVSKESFSGLEGILETFEDNLNSEVESNQDYLSGVQDFAKLQDANSLLAMDFFSQLNDFGHALNDGDVSQQLEQLEKANQAINDQFQENENDAASIISDAAVLQAHFKNASEQVAGLDADLMETIDSDLQSKVAGKLSGVFQDALDDEQTNLSTLFKAPDKSAQKNLQNQINKLPLLNRKEIEGLGLSKQTVTELKNVMAVTNKYNKEFGFEPSYSSDRKLLSQQVQEIKDQLATTGLKVSDTVKIPEIKKSGQILKLNIPNAFKVEELSLTLNNEKIDYHNISAKEVKLPSMAKGEFKVQLKLILQDTNKKIDVFQPVAWGWDMDLKDINDEENPDDLTETANIQEPATPLVATLSTSEKEEDGVQEKQKNETQEVTDDADQPEEEQDEDTGELEDEEENGDTDEPDSEGTPEKEEDNGDEEEENPDSGSGEDESGSPDDGGNKEDEDDEDDEDDEGEDEEETPEKVKIINEHIQHEIMSPLTSNGTKKLIHAASDTVSEYQRLLTLYESYFGLNMESNDLWKKLRQGKLTNLATEDSLHYLFNKKEVADLLEAYMVEQVTSGVTAEVRKPVERLRSQIHTYKQLVDEAGQDSDQLIKEIARTTEQAGIMNQNLGDTLADLADWREASMNLIDEQTEIQSNKEEEQSAFMAMDNGLQSLLTASESLADGASMNLDAADHVYQTFDAIDKQAEDIQESGVTLVGQAQELSVRMTDKLLDDQNFADNFAGVLANSRIGDRQNENLYDFLSNPVQTENDGVIVGGEETGPSFTPYFIVLICFIITLFTAYVISTNTQRKNTADQFEEEKTIVGKNMPMAIVTASIGIVEGLIIGLISGYFLQIGQGKLLMWIGLITMIMLAMLVMATYLLRQLKMIGMFILLVVLSLYLFLTDALGVSMKQMEKLQMFSPLQYVEKLLGNFASGVANSPLSIIILVGVILLGVILNLVILHHSPQEEKEDEGVTEAS